MSEIYEELYERLLNEGIDDSTATAVVNKMYEGEELHDVEVLDEGLFKAATAIGKMMLKGPAKGLAKQIGTGSKATRAMGYGTMRQAQSVLNLPQSQATVRRGLRAGWSPSKALPSGTSAGTRKATLDSLLKAKPPTKSGALVGPGKGGPLASTGKTAGLGSAPKVEPVKVRDLGSAPSSGGPTRYQGTRSGGQLPPGGGTSSRMGKGQKKADIAAAGATNVGPATPSKGSPKPQSLPAAGQSSNRRNVAAATAATAATGTKSTGVRTGTTSAIVKRKPSLGDKVKGALVGAGAALTSPTAKKVAKVAGATALGAGAFGLGAALMSGDKKASTPKKDTAPATPKGGVVADKAPAKPTAPAKPAVSTKKRMTKIDRDMKELMGMRAASMDRQGRSKDAAKLRSEIEKKFAGYED
tara:strand:+ start:222 stop:1460 length:1239 start_codon:yes stop_codon:yes gene_type:complete